MVSAAVLASAQSAVAGRRVCVFTVQNLTPSGEFADYASSITETLEQEFESAGARIVRQASWSKAPRMPQDARDLLRGPVALAVAQDAGADLAVNGTFAVEGEQVLVSLQCWDVAAGAALTGFLRSWRFNLAFYNSLHEEMATRLLPRIFFREEGGTQSAAAAQDPASPQAVVPASSEIMFLAPQEGMQVLVEGDAPAGVIENGRAVMSVGPVPAGTRLRVQKRREGFHTAWQNVQAQPEVGLKGLAKQYSQALELSWTFGQAFGAGATLRRYWDPDNAFFWFANYPYLQPPVSTSGRPVLHYDAGVGVGSYFFLPPGSPVRFGMSTGAGGVLSLTTNGGLRPYLDLYLNIANWWLEARLWGVTVFFRQELKYSIGLDSGGLERGMVMVGGQVPPMTVGVVLRK